MQSRSRGIVSMGYLRTGETVLTMPTKGANLGASSASAIFEGLVVY